MNYAKLPVEYSSFDNSKIVILPVPFDGTSTWIKGADKGPDAIIEASANMELYDIETDSEPCLMGIFTEKPIVKNNVDEMVLSVNNKVSELIKKEKFIVLLGGEHSVSIGSIQAHANKYKDLTVLQLDAHSDLRTNYEGSKNNHACVMARAKEVAKIVQVGIRSMDSEELSNMDKSNVFFAENLSLGWQDEVVKKLSKNVYLTIDLDAFDPSIMPSTGTPEPGGLLWYDVLNLIKKVINNCNLVGMDVVELCPNDNNKGPNFLAAKLVYKTLSYLNNKQ